MNNGDTFQNFNDCCPNHNTELKAEYTFGRNDAIVSTYTGCQCATLKVITGFNDPPQYYQDYQQAKAAAIMHKELSKARY